MKSTLCALALFAFSMSAAFLEVAAQPALAAEATTGILEGSVTAPDGRPVAHAAVAAASASGRYSIRTDARGRFTLLGVVPGDYLITVEAAGYESALQREVRVLSGQVERVSFALAAIRTIGNVQARSQAFTPGATSDTFVVSGSAARANFPTTSSAGLANYTQGTVQGAIANVPGVDLDPFANAILRGGRVGDAAYDYDSVPIPQGLIAEPGGNVDGAQLPTTGVASTSVVLAGYSNEGDNALGGVVNQIAAIGSYPGSAVLELSDGFGPSLSVGKPARACSESRLEVAVRVRLNVRQPVFRLR